GAAVAGGRSGHAPQRAALLGDQPAHRPGALPDKRPAGPAPNPAAGLRAGGLRRPRGRRRGLPASRENRGALSQGPRGPGGGSMRDRSGWLLLGVLAAVAAILILVQNGTQQDSLEHSSKSDGPNGTSALVQYAAALGHPARTVDFAFGVPHPAAKHYVSAPTVRHSASETTPLPSSIQLGRTRLSGGALLAAPS